LGGNSGGKIGVTITLLRRQLVRPPGEAESHHGPALPARGTHPSRNPPLPPLSLAV
jgi:hypothetical protein